MPVFPLVIFDLDGTLVDSADDIVESLNLTLSGAGLQPVSGAQGRSWIGEGVRVLLATALRAQGQESRLDELMPEMMRHYADCLLHQPRLYPGVVEALDGLRAAGCRLMVCTNKPIRFVAPLLQHLGVADYFETLLGGDSLPQRKPDPAPLLHLAALAGLSPQQCLMVGDSATDAGAAQAAQMPLAMVRRLCRPRISGRIAHHQTLLRRQSRQRSQMQQRRRIRLALR